MIVKLTSAIRTFSTHLKPYKYYTTPIYYVNANPHIGHLYSSVIADAIQRWQRVLNPISKIKFATGTDEHGTKIQQAAHKNNVSLPEYCSKISSQYKLLSDEFKIDYTDFIRTTSEEHGKAVHQFWNILKNNDQIYLSQYEGWYCISDETFLTDSQLKETVSPEGKKTLISAESGHPVEWTEEQNYMFKLSSFQDNLINWLTKNDVVKPIKFQKILLDMIRNEPLPNISISRPSSRVHWGVRVPQDDTQTVYVWLDALVNYLTAAGYSLTTSNDNFEKVWPPDVQVIGKDILKFHGIYWPAFLMAANLELPKTILCHSHWTVDGEKMSKSRHNVVCPFNRSEIYTSDGLRYFLLRLGVAHSDGNYSDTLVVRILNSELADTLGNLLSRCTGSALNPNQVFPEFESSAFEAVASLDVTKKLIESVTSLPDTCRTHYNNFNFYKIVDEVIATLHLANQFFEMLKPWELRKDPAAFDKLNVVLHITMESLRVSGILLQPIIPRLAENLLNKIAIEQNERCFHNACDFTFLKNDFKTKQLGSEKMILFKRIEIDKKQIKRS